MEMQAVSSSDVSEIGYDLETATLRIRFLKGSRLYDYYGVPEEIYLGLMNAPSIGQYLNVNIKKGGYPYAQV
jgi:hypothetical protein